MSHYAIVYAVTPGGHWSATVPDLPGYLAAAESFEECRALVAEGVPAHLAFMRLRGLMVPPPSTRTEELAVTA